MFWRPLMSAGELVLGLCWDRCLLAHKRVRHCFCCVSFHYVHLAGTGCLLAQECMPFFFHFSICHRTWSGRYLLAQNCVLPSMVACLATTLLAPLYAWPLVFHSGLRVYGAAAAFGLISATNAALLAGYVVARERRLAGTPQQTWHGWCA